MTKDSDPIAWSAFYQGQATDVLAFCRFTKIYQTHLSLCEGIMEKERLRTILEIGIGRGLYSAYFALKGYSVTGIDSDEQVLDQAKRNCEYLHAKPELMVADMFKLPFPDKSFDMIIHQGVMEHYSSEEIVRALDIQCLNLKKA